MIIRRCDYYVLSEMIGPFLISVGGLLLFILLNLILSLSYLMVDRGVGIVTLMRLLLFKTPSMLVLALPVGALFATFIGLGRLVHDREVMALEAAGISLRRILLPLLVAALFVGAVDFALYNWTIPSSEHAYQQTLREIIFRQGVPHIRSNTFFKGPQGQFFYVRRYDEKEGTLHEVLVYDVDGKLFPQAKSAVTILTAQEGKWEDSAWALRDGRVYGYDHDGALIYTGTFDRLDVAVGRIGTDFLFGSRTPAEMGIGELRARIAILKDSGISADDLIVECHLKVAIPVATLVFVLFGGATSLIFGWRSRAVGVVVSLLLVGIFQGVLMWTQILGRQGVIPAPLGAWIPDLIFGLLGIFLFWRLDRLTHHDLMARLRRLVPFFVILFLLGGSALGEEIPVKIHCEELFVSSDQQHINARGEVRLTYGETFLMGDLVTLDQDDDEGWLLHAEGGVRLEVGEGFTLTGEEVSSELSYEDETLITRNVAAIDFRGESTFKNSKGEEHLLIYRGEEGRISFDSQGEVVQIEVIEGELSTCNCCGGVLRAQPYSLEMGRLLLYPDQLIVGFNLTVRSFGVPVFWLPVYVQPLEETLDSPLFPSIGESSLRGWFFKWNLPFYLNKENYGTILFDYFSRFQEVGLGVVLRYALAGLSGTLRIYSFPARVGDAMTEFSLDQKFSLLAGWNLGGSLNYKAVGEREALSFSFSLTGEVEDWKISLSAARTRTEDEERLRIDERLPELVLSRSSIEVGNLSFSPRLSAGWFREWEDGTLTGASLRVDGTLDIALSQFSLLGFICTPKTSLRFTGYEAGDASRTREVFSASLGLTRPGMTISYAYQEINGKSPFAFDHLVSQNHFSWRFVGEGEIDARVEGGVDLATGAFDPLQLSAQWQWGAAFTLNAQYDLGMGVLSQIKLSGEATGETSHLSWMIPYDPVHGEFDTVTFQARVKDGEQREISLSGEVEPSQGRLTVLSVETAFHMESGWGISLGGRYEAAKVVIVNPSFGLFRDLSDCLRIGIERRSGQVWLYTSILAFPEAILRYAPNSTRFEVGE